MNTQPTDNGLWDNPSKRADELERGQHIIDRAGIPLEVTHTQVRPDGLILVVFANGHTQPYNADAPFTMATAQQIAAMRAAAERGERLAGFRGFIDWLEQHADVQLPHTLRIQGSLSARPFSDQVALAEAFALAHGVTVKHHTYEGAPVVSVDIQVGRYAEYTLYGKGLPGDDLPGPAPISHWRSGIGAACQLTLRLVDRCVDDPAEVDCGGCKTLMPAVEEEPAAPSLRLVEPAPQTDPALRPSYDPNPTFVLHRGETYADKYAAYATALDESNPGWWNDDLDRMAGTLAGLARERRAETWGEGELDHDRIPTAAGFEEHEARKAAVDVDDDVEPPRGTDNGDPNAVLPADVEGHGHERGKDWRDVRADCDDPWHLDTGEIAPTAPCGGCGATAQPTPADGAR